jgi:hypothetical protein
LRLLQQRRVVLTYPYPNGGDFSVWVIYKTGIGETLFDSFILSISNGRYSVKRVGKRAEPVDEIPLAVRAFLDAE